MRYFTLDDSLTPSFYKVHFNIIPHLHLCIQLLSCDISGFHGGEDSNRGLLGCGAA